MSYVGGVSSNGITNPVAATLYGVCQTGASATAKTLTLSNFDALIEGVMISIKFTNGNTAANPTLNVNGTGAFPIYRYSTVGPGTNAENSWTANAIIQFVFEGNPLQGTGAWRIAGTGNQATLATNLRSEITSAATTAANNLTAALTKIAADYSSASTYRINDLCYYGGELYRCNTDITTAEAWTAGHWTATTIAAEREYKLQFTDTVVGVASTVSAEVSGTGVTEATVNKAQWEMVITTTGSYVFSYTGTDWMLNSAIVIPTNYGITITGDAVSGDTITVSYTAGTNPFLYTNTYAAYPYRAIVPLTGVKATMVPEVTFGIDDAISGMYAPVVESYDGGIHIYATNEPVSSITIPVIICWG